jgi:hypothetical protein
MIEIHLKPGKDVLVVKTSGLVRANDYAEAMPEFQKAVAETAPKGLLLDWTELEGWDQEAESIRFFARLDHRQSFARVALLAEGAWTGEVTRLQDIMNVPVRRFSTGDRAAAEAWLEAVV